MGPILNDNRRVRRNRRVPPIRLGLDHRILKSMMGKELTLTHQLKKAARNSPHWTAVSPRGGEFDFDLTRARLQELVYHAAALLAASGIGPGDVVALAFPYTIEFVILFLAVIRCRAAVALLNPAYKAKEFKYHLSDLRSKLLLTPNEGNRLAQSAASELNIPHQTAKLHSADSKITLSSTDIEPDLNSMSRVVNKPSDVALYLCDFGTPRYKFLGVALYFRNRCIPAFYRRSQFTQEELFMAVRDPSLLDGHVVLEFLSSLAARTTDDARSLASRFLNMISDDGTSHRAVVPCQSEAVPEGNNAPKTTEENKTETERGGEEGKLKEESEKFSGPKKFSSEESMNAIDSKIDRPYQSDDMPEGSNAPKTTEKNKTETERGGEEAKLTEALANLGGPKKFSYEELGIATNYFASDQELGQGASGIVYRGHIGEDRTPVAVKKITSGARQGITEYKSEVKSLSQLRHRNLVQLLGYCHEVNEFVLVYELIGGGSLYYHLFEGGPLLTWTRRYNIARGLASALYYLQNQCHQCVMHRDIKSRNVMLDEKFEAKLGDFGLAKLVDHARDPSTTQVKGTLGYLAPEYFRTGKTSKESDIYSFGVVLLEILCGRKASDSELAEQGGLVQWVWKRCGYGSWWGRPLWNLHLPVDKRLGKDFDKKRAEALMILGLLCAHPIASSRPSIEEVVSVLNSKAEPPKLPSKMPSFNV